LHNAARPAYDRPTRAPAHPDADDLFLSFQAAVMGRYVVERELGRGGAGVVFLARELRLERLVALKVLLPRGEAQGVARARFLTEARTAARLSHPHIVPILTVEDTGDLAFLSMPYIAGQTLGERVRSRGPLPPADAARVLREIAWALAYSHGQGIVHRDIKPDNVLLESGTGRTLVLDFGIAGDLAASQPDTVAGTPAFMSPEQIRGDTPDPRSDLYSLSVLGYFLLAARLPFDASTDEAQLLAQLEHAPLSLRTAAPEVPIVLAELVMRGVEKQPDRRPPSAEAFAEALSQWLGEQRPVPAPVLRFLSQLQESRPIGLLYTAFATLMLLIQSVLALGEPWRVPGIVLIAVVFMVPPMLVLAMRVRGLLASGADQEDLLEALEIEADRERRLSTGGSVEGLAWKRPLLRWSIITAVVSALAWLLPGGPGRRDLVFITNLVSVAAAVVLTDQVRRPGRARGRARFWTGPIGRGLFRVARLGLRSAGGGADSGAQRTEVALASSVRALFDRFPKATRAELGEMEEVLERLEIDATRVRRRRRELRSLQSSNPDTDLYAKLSEADRMLERRLAEIVGALEHIRVSLLRLHGGRETLAGVTMDLGRAKDVAERLTRLAEADEEVSALLDHNPDRENR
jgi:eukaryotic-like serine/threonine-protein kinase